MSVVVATPRGSRALRFTGRAAADWLPPIVIFAAAIGAWEGAIALFDIKRFLLPQPTAIAETFWNERGALWSAGWYTFQEALGGFLLGSAAAVLVALALARFRPLWSAVMPYAIAANAVPIIAFAPITNAWFGIEKGSKIAIAAVLCFLPVLINMLRGLTTVRPESIELMRSYAAGELEILRRVRIPNSLPYLFSALRVASVLAMIGAIAGEFFGGSQQQLGIQIKNSTALFRFETAWAAILVACVLGIALYLAVAAVEKLVALRYPSREAAGAR